MNKIKHIGATLVSTAIVAGSMVLPVFAASLDEDQIVLEQKITVHNTNTTDVQVDTNTYTYSIEPVSDADVLGIVPFEGATVTSGLEDAVVLTTESVDFGSLLIEGGVTEYTDSADIVLEVSVENFTSAGIYRYEIVNETTDDFRYLDVYILYEDGELCLSGYNLYEGEAFSVSNMKKCDGFEDSYQADVIEEPEEGDYEVIFRFVDANGNLLADDICVTERRVIASAMLAPVKNASRPSRNGSVSPVNEIVSVNTIDQALAAYEDIKAALINQDYVVTRDDVADHVEGSDWFGTSTTEPMIYYVVFGQEGEPLDTPTPTPTPMATATPVPTDTPTSTPTPTSTGITSTGEAPSVLSHVGLCLIAFGIGFFTFEMISRHINKNSKKNKEEENS